ncbi:MAG: hypothetical protein A2Y33_16745 [Spirochaetes bacterium GWF1_51_8]|nr:MAG: hypothetical protein A2Y33_16745 [Spirochaetes bacterium GWF1_51_8]
MLQGKLNPEFLGKMNAVFEKNLSAILNDIARQKMIEENKGKIFINLTNTQYKTVTNKISVNDTFLGVLVVNKLIINGNFQYLENVNSFNTVYYTNESMKFHSGYAVDLYPGLNFLRFGMYNGYFTKNSWDYFNEKLFVINNISLKNTNLNLDEFSIAPVSHILFGWGFKMYLPTGNYFLNFDFGFRFAIGKSSKIRIVLNICDLRDYNYYNGNWNVYNYPNAAFKVGFESKIGERMNQFDYMYAWFADGYYAGDHIGIDGGISVRLDPLFSINLGLDISYFFARKHSDWYYDALYHYVSVSLDKPGEFDFAFFLQYEFFVPISHNYKNYEFDY